MYGGEDRIEGDKSGGERCWYERDTRGSGGEYDRDTRGNGGEYDRDTRGSGGDLAVVHVLQKDCGNGYPGGDLRKRLRMAEIKPIAMSGTYWFQCPRTSKNLM